jgi:hypothetical protein
MKSRKLNVSRDLQAAKVYQSISYQTLLSSHGANYTGTRCADTAGVPRKKNDSNSQIVPITNAHNDIFDEQADKLAVYRLRRQVTALRASEKNLLGKLSRCLEVIADQERFLDLGLTLDQWETYSELLQRKARLRGCREMIVDVDAEQKITDQEAKALKEKFRL